MATRVDFTGQTITDPRETYTRCRFKDTIMQGRIAIVLADCLVESLTLRRPEIIQLETRGSTSLMGVRIEKSTIQPIHWLRSIAFLKHRHEFITATIRIYANTIRRTNPDLSRELHSAAHEVDNEPSYSWNEFLLSVSKEAWDAAEDIFADLPEIRDHAVSVREKRWPVR